MAYLNTRVCVVKIGTLKNNDGNATKTSLENISSRYLYYFAIIPIRSTRIMWPNYPVTELVGMALKLKRRMKNLLPCAHVVHKTLNLVTSRCYLAEYGEKMYQNSKCTCTATVLLLLFCDVLVAVAVVGINLVIYCQKVWIAAIYCVFSWLYIH